MADHSELVTEMAVLEQMGTQERQKLAKKRRLQQLKKWGQREKELMAKEKQLNKRLANMISEENNGLNLKHYTSYNSNTRKRPISQIKSNGTTNNNNNNNSASQPDNNNQKPVEGYQPDSKPESKLAPKGKVHFNVGVMLLEAAARNDYDEVKRLLMLGGSPDSINHDGLTALHQCCIDASEPIMKLLLEFGANVDARDTEQWTPLHAAATCGHLNLVKILVEHGANLLAVNGDGNMPFDACEDEQTLAYIEAQMVERGITQEMIDTTRASTEMQLISDLENWLAESSAKLDDELTIVNKKDNVSLLHVAAANGYISAVKFLLDHGANPNVCDNDLWTPLHGAACWGGEQHVKIIELLVEAGAKLNAKTINEETVFDLCDNGELLERLNQIKEELESKQAAAAAAAAAAANGTDERLKRTQSRTNSRVHSIRRTSVRDKNQISRREARQEAMLRNESSASLDKPAGSGPAKSPPPPSLSAIEPTKKPPEIQQTDLDKPEEEEQEHVKEQEAEIGGARSQKATNSITEPTDEVKVEAEVKVKVKVKEDEPKPSRSKRTSTTITLLNGTGPQKGSPIGNSQPTGKQPLPNGNSKPPADTTDGLGPSQTTTSIQTTTPTSGQVAFIAPINYTLSNLKKQRSDLRMRNSSIGLITNTTTIKTANGIALSASPQVVELDPRPEVGLLNGGDGELANNCTIRKFSGEPSETVGGSKKLRQRVCCIVI